jgi:hypothetical protein
MAAARFDARPGKESDGLDVESIDADQQLVFDVMRID